MRAYGCLVDGDRGDRRWRVGELAAAAGLSVRALRLYDEIGLLVPSERSSAGHRRYAEGDLRRLYEILALRRLGLSLVDVSRVLDHEHDLRLVIGNQLRQVERSINVSQALRRRLHGLLAALEREAKPTVENLTTLMKEMSSMENRLDPEQLRELTEGRRRMNDRLSATELAELAESRRSKFDQLTQTEIAEMARRRSVVGRSVAPEGPS